MGRVAKKAPETPKAVEESPTQTVTQTRAKRTPKPNPKYANDSVVIPPKIESSESNGSTDIEDKLPETKIVKSTKKVISKAEDSVAKTRGTPKAKAQPITVKKQKIEFDDDEKTKDADEVPIATSPTPRTTRSGAVKDEKGEIKVGEESVAIIDVSSIIAKGPAVKPDASPKGTPVGRGQARKRGAQEVVEVKEESPKKKKEEEKSLITTRKSYIAAKKDDVKVEEVKQEEKQVPVEKKEPLQEVAKTPAVSTMKTRRTLATPQASEPIEKKTKVEDTKPETVEIVKPVTVAEPKKLPVVQRKEQITKVSPMNVANKTVNNVTDVVINEPKPAPRLLNSMITPKSAKLSPNVKLAGDGSNKKVFSIDMSDDSLIEKKQIITTAATIKTSPVKQAVKENVAINKPQPSVLLKNKLESELIRMKASANLMKRQTLSTPSSRYTAQANAQNAARRITKFESWYVIDVKNTPEPVHKNHTHTFSLIRIGNKLKELQLPSSKWDFKVTLTRRQPNKQNNNDDEDEIYTGDVHDPSIDAEKHNFEPNSILFKRSHRDNNKTIIDRSLMIKQNVYTITMNGKQCHLVGAPDDIKSLEDLEILLKIIDTCSVTHSCVETTS